MHVIWIQFNLKRCFKISSPRWTKTSSQSRRHWIVLGKISEPIRREFVVTVDRECRARETEMFGPQLVYCWHLTLSPELWDHNPCCARFYRLTLFPLKLFFSKHFITQMFYQFVNVNISSLARDLMYHQHEIYHTISYHTIPPPVMTVSAWSLVPEERMNDLWSTKFIIWIFKI